MHDLCKVARIAVFLVVSISVVESVSVREGRLLLKLSDDSSSFQQLLLQAKGVRDSVHKQYLRRLRAQQWELHSVSEQPQLHLLKFDNRTLAHDTLSAALASIEGVQSAEPDHKLYAMDFSARGPPNDPAFPDQWGMHQLDLYSPDAAILQGTPPAWAYTQGSSSIIVCVIDSGIDYNHPDLAPNIWTNAGEIPGNGIDDDHNGYIDDVHGWNFITNTGNMLDDYFHGSHLAGIVGASCNDGYGVCGVSPKVSLMGCKFLDSQGSGFTSDAIRCLQYALRNGAHITLNSYGSMNANSSALSSAVFASQNAGQLFVTAAGNDYGANIDNTPVYPASYNFSNVVAVIAINESGGLADYSNYGPASTDIAAPGSDILSTELSGEYGNHTGTSQAAAFVAGAAALLLSAYSQAGRNVNGLGTTIRQDLVTLSATPVAGFDRYCLSGGKLDVGKGVAAVSQALGLPAQASALAPRPAGPSVSAAAASASAPGPGNSRGTAAVPIAPQSGMQPSPSLISSTRD